jgi:hypothetical protein
MLAAAEPVEAVLLLDQLVQLVAGVDEAAEAVCVA